MKTSLVQKVCGMFQRADFKQSARPLRDAGRSRTPKVHFSRKIITVDGLPGQGSRSLIRDVQNASNIPFLDDYEARLYTSA